MGQEEKLLGRGREKWKRRGEIGKRLGRETSSKRGEKEQEKGDSGVTRTKCTEL